MPKPPRFDHPLRKLRRMLGPTFTQEHLAKEIGVAAISIKRIENGTLKLSPAMKRRLMVALLVDPDSLDGREPLFLGRPYKRRVLRELRSTLVTRAPGEPQATLSDGQTNDIHVAKAQAGALLFAAADRNRLHVVLYLWGVWLDEMLNDFALRPAYMRRWKEAGLFRATARKSRNRSTKT